MKTHNNKPGSPRPMPRAINVHSRFFGLLKHFHQADKEDLVWSYSGMLTTSLSEFYQKKPEGYKAMVNDLQQKVDSMKPNKTQLPTPSGVEPVPSPIEEARKKAEIKKLRSAILHRLQKYGIDTTNWDKVNSFMENPRIAGKMLYSMDIAEMRAFIRKMQSILAKNETHEKEIARQASMN